MAGAKGEQTTRVHFFSHLLVGWAAHCGTNGISPQNPLTPSVLTPLYFPLPLSCDRRRQTSDSRITPAYSTHKNSPNSPEIKRQHPSLQRNCSLINLSVCVTHIFPSIEPLITSRKLLHLECFRPPC